MDYTVKQLANKLKISRSGLEMRISKIPQFREKYTHKSQNRIIITEKGAELIHKKYGVNQHVNQKHMSSNDGTNKDLTIKILRHQLNDSNASQKRLEKLLDQQQQLQLSTQHENNQLKGQIKHIKAINGPSDKKPEEKGETVRKPKLSFWQRLFGQH